MQKDQSLLLLPPATLNEVFEFDISFKKALQEYRMFSVNIFTWLHHVSYRGDDAKLLYRIYQLSDQTAYSDGCYQ